MARTPEEHADLILAGALTTCEEIAADYITIKSNFVDELTKSDIVKPDHLDQLARYSVASQLAANLAHIIGLRKTTHATSELVLKSVLDYYEERLVLAPVLTDKNPSSNNAYMAGHNAMFLQNIVGYLRSYTTYLVMY